MSTRTTKQELIDQMVLTNKNLENALQQIRTLREFCWALLSMDSDGSTSTQEDLRFLLEEIRAYLYKS